MVLRLDSKSIFVQATSVIGDKDVASFSATVSGDGDLSQVYRSITDKDTFNENKAQVQTDLNAFQAELFSLQDSLIAEVKANVDKDKEE